MKDEMQDLENAYRDGIMSDLQDLRAAIPLLESGDEAVIDTVRDISHRLKGSGTSYGHPEITALADVANRASDADLAATIGALVDGLEVVTGPGGIDYRIALVDDDPLIRMILTKILAAPNREFFPSGSLAEARANIDPSVDLVLVDVLLPDGNGTELARELHANPEFDGVPVVVMSGSDDDATRRGAAELGAAAFVEKPFDPQQLDELVGGLLEGRGKQTVTIRSDQDAPQTLAEDPPIPATVLLAEDDALVAALIEDRLSRDGYEIRLYVDGESALAGAISSPPDLAILDVMMPKMNGFEVLGRLRASTATAELPIIMLTGRGREEDVIHGFDLGATDYIIKPFSPAEVAVRVRRYLAHA